MEIDPNSVSVEVTEKTNDPQIPQKVEKIAAEVIIEEKFSAMRKRVAEHVQNVLELIKLEKEINVESDVHQEINPEELLSQIRKVSTNQAIQDDNFISQSNKVLLSASSFKDQLNKEINLEFRNIQDLEEKISKLEQTKGLKKLMNILERNKLIKVRDKLQAQLDTKYYDNPTTNPIITEISELELYVSKKRSEVISSKKQEAVKSIVNENKNFVIEISSNGEIMKELLDAYIRDRIIPDIDYIVKSSNLQSNAKDEYLKLTYSFIEKRGESRDENRALINNGLTKISPDAASDIFICWNPLIAGIDKTILQMLFVNKLLDDIEPIKRDFLLSLGNSHYVNNLRIVSELDGGRQATYNDGNFWDLIQIESRNPITHLGYSFGDIWESFKSSKILHKLLEKEINFKDKKFYDCILEKSLVDEDGGYIDSLKYYPTPDGIRNLVLIACADAESYRTEHANKILKELNEREDWNQILNNTMIVYPELSALRNILETGSVSFTESSLLQELAAKFALKVIEINPSNEELRSIALEAIPNNVLLEILVRKAVLTSNQSTSIQKAVILIEKLHKETYTQSNQIDSKIEIQPYYLKTRLREVLLALSLNEGERSIDLKNRILQLAALSEKILERHTDQQFISYLVSEEFINLLVEKKVDSEVIVLIPQYENSLLSDRFENTKTYVFDHADTLLRSVSDLKFIGTLLGEFSQKADTLIRGYNDCLTSGIVNSSERELVLELARKLRIISPIILTGYKEAKKIGSEDVYIADLKALSEKMTGYGTITPEEINKPYYKEMIRQVYAKNSLHWTTYEKNETCSDRSSDLAHLKIQPRYTIDLLSQSEIKVKEGETLDPKVKESVQKPVLESAERMNNLGNDKEKMQLALQESVNKTFEEVIKTVNLQGINLESVLTLDEKLFVIIADSIYGTKTVDLNLIKGLIIDYEFTNFEDIREYITGTTDRVRYANNQDYALLCELETFYSDRIKEVNRRLVQTVWDNPTIALIMESYFLALSKNKTVENRKNLINRLNITKLGTSEGFVKQLGLILERKRGRKYTQEEVKAIIKKYEGYTNGLTEEKSTSSNKDTRAFYGQLRSQREKTFNAFKNITGEQLESNNVHLGEINLQEALDTETRISEGKYNKDQFASYTIQRILELFESERSAINTELMKYESVSGKQKEVLYGYITKTKESANARMVGGVCVSGDNEQWNMPNYLQLVFQDPESSQCQGLVLLHYFEEDGKKLLTASLNPSSTYLFSVDESALFKGILSTLEKFSTENGIDMILTSRITTIRTNRTGGLFERELENRITEIGKIFKFATRKQFSFNPVYFIKDMDVIWESTK